MSSLNWSNSEIKIFVIIVKVFKLATSCERDHDATTAPARHMWEIFKLISIHVSNEKSTVLAYIGMSANSVLPWKTRMTKNELTRADWFVTCVMFELVHYSRLGRIKVIILYGNWPLTLFAPSSSVYNVLNVTLLGVPNLRPGLQ